MESNIPAYNEIKSQADAVLYFFQRMDIEMIDTLLEDDRKYQDFEKNIFIEKLGIALDEFRKAGDTSLNRYSGHCILLRFPSNFGQ